MSDEVEFESVEPSEGDELKAQLRRRVYVMARLEAIKEELQALRQERAALTAQIRESGGADVRPLVRRRTYVSMHQEVLADEQKRLLAERRTLSRKA